MRRLFLSFCLSLAISLTLTSTALAWTGDSGKDPDPVVDDAGGGGSSGGEGEGPAPPPAEPKEPSVLSYTPVVTAIHSLNALLAEDGDAVYFMPQLQDFPADLVSACADVTTEDGKQHKFAVVYDGYFDTEVAYSLAQNDNTDTADVSRLQTSKKVYSQSDNSRTLNLLGYDLLLADERASIVTQGEKITATYLPTLVGNAPLTAKTVVMDLYKAVGVYEWDIKVAFGIDEELAVNTSPIMQQIAVLTNDEVEGGIDVSEGATYVWATRTNPDIYWLRCKRDAIFDGGAHLYTKDVYVGNNVSVTFSKNETQTVTMLEFLQLARAFMELYGEPVLTEMEISNMIQAYALTLPTGNMSDEGIEAVRYLAAKGIIDPADMQFDKTVTFKDIEEILLRIADENSRLTFKQISNPNHTMSQAGYVKVPLATSNVMFDKLEEVTNPFDTDYFDYYIEAVDGKTNFYLNKLAGIDLTEQDNLVEEEDDLPPATDGGVGSIPVDPIIQDGKAYAFACDKLVVAGADNVPTTTGSGYFEYCGMDTYSGRYYYHFKISRTLGAVTIQYDVDPELEQLLDITSYSLPDANGGVYNFSEDLPEKLTFSEAGFSDQFVDSDRLENDYLGMSITEPYLSDWTWVKMDITTDNWDKMVRGTADARVFVVNTSIKNQRVSVVVTAQDLNQARNTSDRRFVDTYGNVWYVTESVDGSNTTYITLLCQTKLSIGDFTRGVTNLAAETTNTSAYYKAEDGTLLASYEYLKAKGLCSNIQSLPSGNGLCISTRNGNVSLRNDLDLIVVGDTAIPANGDMLYYQDGNSYYINMKACLGWSNDYVVVTTEDVLIPLFKNTNNKYVTTKSTTKTVKAFFPSSSVNVGYFELKTTAATPQWNGKGVHLATSNPLGCYMVVYDANHDSDYLFVWHRNKVVDSGGSEHSVDDNGAMSKFRELTGVDVGKVDGDYTLTMFPLNRNNQGNPSGVRFCFYEYKTMYSEGTSILGYVYDPPKFDSIDAAFSAYISGSDNCALPIASVGGKYVNLNMNTCTDMEGNKQLPIGTLPMYMESSASTSQDSMGSIQSSGSSVKTTSATYENLESVKIYTAPVGLFQTIKGLGTRSLSDWTRGAGGIFFGSSKCEVKNGKILIKGHPLEFDTNVDAVCTLLSTGSSSVFVINEDSSSLGKELSESLEDFAVIVTDPETLIDWSQYKFKRLVENMDSWTSILLIFVLNILPRIGMLLFFCLMLLSLIKDVKFWRAFCVNHFDVYSFLTMGKQNVDTVDMKKVVAISLICFSIFLVIMDGQLFNFIIFICRLIINITQR